MRKGVLGRVPFLSMSMSMSNTVLDRKGPKGQQGGRERGGPDVTVGRERRRGPGGVWPQRRSISEGREAEEDVGLPWDEHPG